MIRFRRLAITSVSLAVFGAASFGAYLYLRPEPILPPAVSKQVRFEVFYPDIADDQKSYVVPRESIRYDASTQVLSYRLQAAGTTVVINQQPEPELFREPAAQVSLYQKMLEKMHQYAELDTDFGKVTLTRPDELKGGQAAVANQRGTLLFAQPEKNLTEDQWHELFDTLRAIN